MSVPETQQILPREGSVSLEQIARLVAAAPSKFGIPDTCEVRSVLVQREDGRWANHCTVLRLGTSATPPSDSVQDKHVGGARLISREFSAESITDVSQLLGTLTAWQIALPPGFLKHLETSPHGPAVEERPWDFQESANVYHNGSENPWGREPCWVIDLFDRQSSNRGFNAPRGPFRHLETELFAPDLGTLTKNWCSDPSWRESSSVVDAYRIVIPDHRAYIDTIKRRGREIEINVVGTRTSHLKGAVTAWDRKGNDRTETRDVSAGQVRFLLPDSTQGFELYVLDDSETWCDRCQRTELDSLRQDRGSESPRVVRTPEAEDGSDLKEGPAHSQGST